MNKPEHGLQVIVRSIRMETPDIRSFVLEMPDGGDLPPFLPGAHIDVEPMPGVVRQYSLAGDPADRRHYLLGVKKEPHSRGGSSAMHSVVQEGSALKISAPKNNFGLQQQGARRLLLAGGIGITPLLSMASVLHRQGTGFELHYFIRSNTDLAFQSLFALVPWRDRVYFHMGLVPPALTEFLADVLSRPGTADQIYMCGPSPFMELIRNTADTAGWRRDQVFFEYFSASPPALTPDGADFVVRLNSSGRELIVPPGKTIIEILRENGVEIETSCEQGICGTCVTRCLDGDPDHHDLYLSDKEHEEERLFTPCVSRARSKFLVIDL